MLRCFGLRSSAHRPPGNRVRVLRNRDRNGLVHVKEADAHGFKIKYIIETHLHADFVSGHRELSARTGAEIVFSKTAGAAFPHRAVKEGDEIKLGKVMLRIMETPGHTPESICI